MADLVILDFLMERILNLENEVYLAYSYQKRRRKGLVLFRSLIYEIMALILRKGHFKQPKVRLIFIINLV